MNDTLFINRINSILASKGIDKKTFYANCNITSAAFSLWTTGKTSPREKKLREIADYLGVSVEYLINGDHADNHAEHNNGGIYGLSDFEKTVIALMRTNSEFKAQVDLAVELAKRKAAQKDG